MSDNNVIAITMDNYDKSKTLYAATNISTLSDTLKNRVNDISYSLEEVINHISRQKRMEHVNRRAKWKKLPGRKWSRGLYR